MKTLTDLLAAGSASGKPFVLATVLTTTGSAPQQAGARMIVYIDGVTVGTVGGGCVEGTAIREAIRLLVREQPAFTVLTIELNAAVGDREGDVCGGTMLLLLEILLPA